MAEARRWPALVVRATAADATGETDGLVTLALDGCDPLAIEDLNPLPLPPGGLWDPTAPPPQEPPPAALAWRICFKDDADRARAIAAIGALARDLTLEAVDLPDDDWVARSQQALTRVTAAPFVVAPPWDLPDAATLAPGHHLVVIEPSMGFGTGHHPTTRLCLRALGTLPLQGRRVVDLGTGSGVLALAAALAGAARVTGIDVDEDAIAAAERSAALNAPPTPVRFVRGEVGVVGEPADLVLANLTGAMLTRAADALARWVAPGGALIVSGYVEEERPAVERALAAFAVERRFEEDGWCAATLRRHA